MDWDEYEPYAPGVSGPLQEQARSVARAAYRKLMAAKEVRKAVLDQLLRANGLELDDSDRGIQRLDEWFRESVEQDPDDEPGRLKPMWYSVVNDVALFLGDVIIARAPNLRWAFFTGGKRNLSYQRHVVIGFPVSTPNYNVDVDMYVAIYGQRVVAGESNRDDLLVYFAKGAVDLAKTGETRL